jgi:hypothetical protein
MATHLYLWNAFCHGLSWQGMVCHVFARQGLFLENDMRVAKVELTSVSRYSQGKVFTSQKSRDQTHEEFEKQCWRERLHVTADGKVFIPPQSFKSALDEAAKYKSVQIPGKGKATYTKHFLAGVLCLEPLVLPTIAADVPGEWLFVPADGKKGGPKRVMKCFPYIEQWSGQIEFTVFDDIIDEQTFLIHLEDAGKFIGVGRFRPRNGGFYGRFKVNSVQWSVV